MTLFASNKYSSNITSNDHVSWELRRALFLDFYDFDYEIQCLALIWFWILSTTLIPCSISSMTLTGHCKMLCLHTNYVLHCNFACDVCRCEVCRVSLLYLK